MTEISGIMPTVSQERQTGVAPEVELDLGRYELRRRGKPVRLERKPMELLIFLVSRRDQLVTRDEIIGKLWGSGLFVDAEPNINNIVRKVRTALADHAERPRFLETVIGKGYRFVGPLRVVSAHTAETHPAFESHHSAKAEAASERSALGVLPLALVGETADDHGLSLGFADALVSRLGNLPGIDVLPTSAVVNVPANRPAAETAARLGVRFLVCGAMRMSKGQWRLSLEMSDSYQQRICFARKCDLEIAHLVDLADNIARGIAAALHRPLRPPAASHRPRYSKDPVAYSEFMLGYRLNSSGDPASVGETSTHLANAVTRDPSFSLAHAELSLVCAIRHFETDPASVWLEKAEFHCQRALDLDPDLPEGHVARAFLLWGPSKNFQHLEAIAELKRALALQNNLPHAYNRLGTILAHIGLLDHARAMYERARPFHPQKIVSHSIVQVYVWNHEYDLAREEIDAWRAESPRNKYAIYFAPQLSIMTGEWTEAEVLLEEALQAVPEEPTLISLLGVFHALTGDGAAALECMAKACAIPKSFGHAHHTYYQIAEILSVLGRSHAAMEWLERAVATGFACWPFFLRDPCLENLRAHADFEGLVSSLQAKYPDHLGVL